MPQYKELGMKDISIAERLSTTIQTHNAVIVPGSGSSPGTYFDCAGYDQISITLVNDAATNNGASLWWSHDGVNDHGLESILISSTQNRRSARTSVKARYARLHPFNTDAAAHTMSAWAYLIT